MKSATGEPDRRTRKHRERTSELLAIAAELFDESGPDGVTLTAIAERADLATPSLYTYFSSKSALLAALQSEALTVLADALATELDRWRSSEAEGVIALARLLAFSELFLDAPALFPREFGLQQQMLIHPHEETPADAATVLPAALAVLALPSGLLDAAAECGAISMGGAELGLDPLAATSMGRTVMWISALNGILLADSLTVGLPATGRALGQALTLDLLVAWRADATELDTARDIASGWARERTS